MPVQVDGSICAILDDQGLVQLDISIQVVVVGPLLVISVCM